MLCSGPRTVPSTENDRNNKLTSRFYPVPDSPHRLPLQKVLIMHLCPKNIITFKNTARHRGKYQHNTCHAADFTMLTHHLSLFGGKLSYKGAPYFNRLPDHLKQEPTKTLKIKQNLWLQDNHLFEDVPTSLFCWGSSLITSLLLRCSQASLR
ncbi:hypothetical protein J6590_100366 [Homalodisca vitripennis]|nr:hypothetical protein J6590_100366 [Homalodisca vitripennis]